MEVHEQLQEIAARHGYKCHTAYRTKFGDGSTYTRIQFSPADSNDRYRPDVYYDEDDYGRTVEGIDRFKINHSSFGSLTVAKEKEFAEILLDVVQMCEELNEVDLTNLRTNVRESTLIRSRNKLSRAPKKHLIENPRI